VLIINYPLDLEGEYNLRQANLREGSYLDIRKQESDQK